MALYYVRSFKRWLGVGGRPWVNTYEVITQGSSVSTPGLDPVDVGPLEAFIQTLIGFERQLHLTQVYLERVVVSTWIPDSNPYNGDELMSRPQGVFGDREGAGDREDLRFCLAVVRTPILGNPGKLPLRGVLLEADKQANTQGIAQLLPSSDVAPGGATWQLAQDAIAPYFTGGAQSGDVSLCMIHSPSPETYSVRGVVDFSPIGIAKVDLTHKFYNQS